MRRAGPRNRWDAIFARLEKPMQSSLRSAAPDQPSTRRTHRWAIAAAIIGLVLFSAGYVAWWMMTTNALRSATLAWIDKRAAEGYRIDYVAIERSGFPWAAQVVLREPTIAASGTKPAWSWSVGRVIAEIAPLRPHQLTLRAFGEQQLEGSVDNERVRYTGAAKDLTAVVVRGGWLPAGSLAVRDLSLTADQSEDAIDVARLDVAAEGDPAVPVDERAVTYQLDMATSDLRLPNTLALPLGSAVQRLAMNAKLLGPLEPEPWPESLTRWREAGGTVEISRLDVAYGPLSLDGEGTLALDRNNQPEGAFTARLRGFRQAVDALQQRRMVEAKTADTVRRVLEALAKPSGDGPRTVQVPLTLQNQVLSVGPLPLLRVPKIAW